MLSHTLPADQAYYDSTTGDGSATAYILYSVIDL